MKFQKNWQLWKWWIWKSFKILGGSQFRRVHKSVIYIINYRLIHPYIGIEAKKDSYGFINHEDDLLREGKIDLLKNKKNKIKGGNIINNIKNKNIWWKYKNI